MRQFCIYYKRGTGNFSRLEPNVHHNLYDRPEITAAVDYMRDNPHIEGVAVRLGDEAYNIVSFTQEAEAPRAFKF